MIQLLKKHESNNHKLIWLNSQLLQLVQRLSLNSHLKASEFLIRPHKFFFQVILHHKAPLGSFSNTVIFRNRNTFELFFFKTFVFVSKYPNCNHTFSLKLKQRVKSSNKNLQFSDYAVCKSLINTVQTRE